MERWKKGRSRENEKTPLFFFEDPFQGPAGQPSPSQPHALPSASPCLLEEQNYICHQFQETGGKGGRLKAEGGGPRFLSLDHVRTNRGRPPESQRGLGHPDAVSPETQSRFVCEYI